MVVPFYIEAVRERLGLGTGTRSTMMMASWLPALNQKMIQLYFDSDVIEDLRLS